MSSRLKRRASIAIVFLLGIAIGMRLPPFIEHLVLRFSSETPADRAEYVLARFSYQFGLNAEQREKARVILAHQRERLQSLRGEVEPRLQAVIDESRTEMREVIPEGQRARFDEINRHMDEWRREMLKRGPPPTYPLAVPPALPPATVGGE